MPNPVQIVGEIIDSVLDEMFPAEKAAADVICALLDKVMASVKRRGLFVRCNLRSSRVLVLVRWMCVVKSNR